MRFLRAVLSFLIVVALFAPLALAVQAQVILPDPPKGGEGEGEGAVENPVHLLRPLQPNQHILSGSVAMIARGIDNRMFINGEGTRTTDGADFSRVESPLNVGVNAPLRQGAGPGVLVPYRDPAPAFSRNLLVTRDFSDRTLQTEPTLAVNPQDPDHLVMATIDYNFPSNSIYVSIDGGASWEGPRQMKYLRDDLGSGGDPVLAFDSKGNVYGTMISIGVADYDIGSAAGAVIVSSIAIATSNDGGFTWNDPVSSARSTVSSNVELDPTGRIRGTVSFGFLDKPWIVAGPHPTIEDQEMVYVSYTEFVTRYDILYIGELPVLGVPTTLTTPKLVYSSDAGQTWSEPKAVGPTVRSSFGENEAGEGGFALEDDLGGPLDVTIGEDADYRQEVLSVILQEDDNQPVEEGQKRTIQGPVPVVDSQGNVFVAWLDSTDDEAMKGLGELYIAKSEDGGETWGKPTRIASFLEIPFRPRNAFFRYWGSAFPKLAIGPQDELYVVYTALPPENPYDEGDIFFIRSTNGGTRWSRPKKLNQDETSAAQFFPALDVGPDGRLHVMWGDMRDDPVGTRYHIYYTSSEDQGDTWGFTNTELDLQVPDTRVTDFSTNPNRAFPSGAFIGDYFAIDATADDVYMVWADGRLGEFGGVNQKIGFARQRAVPSPEIFLSPDAGPGGETITVQGYGFQPAMDYFLQVGGATVSAGRTNNDGVITANVFVPISGEGAHPVSLVDESGNVASTSFYMEFGFDNIQSSLDALDQQIEQLAAATPLTTTSGTVTTTHELPRPAPQQLARYEGSQVAALTAQLQTLQATVQELQAAVTAPVVTASGLAVDPAWQWGLAALGGMALGAIFMFVSLAHRRKDGE
jgi:hypothetical protein